jgi:hypothetical protein
MVYFFYINFDVLKFNIFKNKFFFVWVEDDHSFMSIFSSLKFIKLIIDDRRPDTCKTILFVVFRDHPMIKSIKYCNK